MSGASDEILGHLSADEREVFYRFLALIRENYKKADKAAAFLERRAGVANTCGITNLRDVLSHLSSLLDPKTPPDKRQQQLASAEEHLRRAIIEPYELGLADRTDKFTPVYDDYRKRFLPATQGIPGFSSAPNRIAIEGRLAEVDELAEKGKLAKGRNLWDDDWEDGVSSLIDAYAKLADLHGELEDWVSKYNQHVESKAQGILGKRSLVFAAIAFIIGIVLTFLFTRYAAQIAVPSAAPTAVQTPAKASILVPAVADQTTKAKP